jgi:coenzyme F420-0:L-glutamate ligase / coenzyme F420-1:gamma-L-glutamate ligase
LNLPALSFRALAGLPEIEPAMRLAPLIATALRQQGLRIQASDALLVCQKIVSKADGRFVRLDSITASARALELAARCGKDPRLVELVLQESSAVLRCVKDVLIVRHRLGFVVANAGIDQSNVPGSTERVLLLPRDPDLSAARLRAELAEEIGCSPIVIITDSFGRPWRQGVCGTAIGAAGIAALLDRRGERDRSGRPLQVTQVAVADALAAAAALQMGEAAEGTPVVLATGLSSSWGRSEGRAQDLIRPLQEDLFQ